MMRGWWADDERMMSWWWADEQMTTDWLLADYWLTTWIPCDFCEIAAYSLTDWLTWVVSRDASASKNISKGEQWGARGGGWGNACRLPPKAGETKWVDMRTTRKPKTSQPFFCGVEHLNELCCLSSGGALWRWRGVPCWSGCQPHGAQGESETKSNRLEET